MTNQRIDNIFNLVFNNDELIKMGNSILDKYYFCHNSMKEIVQKLKVPIYRDISIFARKMVTERQSKENRSDYLDPNEVNPILLEDSEISGCLTVAAGRSKPSDILKMFNEDIFSKNKREDASSTTKLEQKNIIYRELTSNISTFK